MPLKSLISQEKQHYMLHREGQDVIAGLTHSPKSLPAKYFYDDRGSELFERICELPEYYPTRTEASILCHCADEIAQITGACELVEFGNIAYIQEPELCKLTRNTQLD
jgi:L-histidine Nalpha-methyltransferase